MFSPDNQYFPARAYSVLLFLSFVILVSTGCLAPNLSKSKPTNTNQPKSPIPLKAQTNSSPLPKISVQAGVKAELTAEPTITPITSPTPATLVHQTIIKTPYLSKKQI